MPGNCQRPDVLAFRILVRPVKMNQGPDIDRLPLAVIECLPNQGRFSRSDVLWPRILVRP